MLTIFAILFCISRYFFDDNSLLRTRIYNFICGIVFLFFSYFYFFSDEKNLITGSNLWYYENINHYFIIFGIMCVAVGVFLIYQALYIRYPLKNKRCNRKSGKTNP